MLIAQADASRAAPDGKRPLNEQRSEVPGGPFDGADVGVEPVLKGAGGRGDRQRREVDQERSRDRGARSRRGGPIALGVPGVDRFVGDQKREDVRHRLLGGRVRREREENERAAGDCPRHDGLRGEKTVQVHRKCGCILFANSRIPRASEPPEPLPPAVS